MWTMMMAAALLVQPTDSVTVPGVVVDTAGKPVSSVEVVLQGSVAADGSAPALARTMTDDRGEFRLKVAKQRLNGIGPLPFIWAYRPGRSFAIQEADLTANGPLPPVRLTLAGPRNRTVTILDAEGRPLAGVRLVPLLHALNGKPWALTPDDWFERLTVATGADGVATISYLPAASDPLTMRVIAPGLVPHDLALPYRPGNDRIALKLGRPARLAGSVYQDTGRPAANIAVEVWVENLYVHPAGPDENRKARRPPSLVHFDSGPVRTEADGSFLTPPQLMTGPSYQIIIRPEGGPPVTSDWLAVTTERTTVPTLRLQQHRKLSGFVHDRGGLPVAGAQVFLPSGEPSTTTDARGRFLLAGILPARTYILVRAEGFRLQGWPGVPARQPQERKITLVRTSEPPDHAMAPLPAPISFEESRTLARRVLEPYLQAALAKGDDGPKMDCLRILSTIDPARVLELLENHPLGNPTLADSLWVTVAAKRIAVDPVRAESIVAAFASPESRALGYARLAEALPAAERDRKRGLLERATVQVHTPAAAGRAINSQRRLFELARVADGWLNFGELDKARPLVREGLEMVAAPPKAQRYQQDFLKAAARVEPDRILSLIREVSAPRARQSFYAEVAESLASEHPAEAERAFLLLDERISPLAFARMHRQVALRLCRRMAKSDPERARRIIVGLKAPGEQALAWALLALGLADRDKPAARAALTESIKAIDRLLGLAGAAERQIGQGPLVINPAASILPIVESVAPERLEDVFWRAVALMPKNDGPLPVPGFGDPRVARTAIFLARYDRQVAAALTPLVDQALRSPPVGRGGNFWEVIWVKAVLDPRGAVALIEALPPGGPVPRHPTNRARIELATCLAAPPAERWKTIWSYAGIDLD